MEFPDRMSHKTVSRAEEELFEEMCELLELELDQVDYLIYEDFDEVDYSMYDDFDDMDSSETWTPEHRIIEVYYTDGTREEIEVELDSELDETLKRILGDI